MPKEIVFSQYEFIDDPESVGVPVMENERSYVHVGWDRNGTVQIATVAPRGAIAPFDPVSGKHVIAGGLEPGWFLDLDREAINQLIRNLRKARDAAFGRDE